MIVSDENDNIEVPVHWVDTKGQPHDKIYPRNELTTKDPFLSPF